MCYIIKTTKKPEVIVMRTLSHLLFLALLFTLTLAIPISSREAGGARGFHNEGHHPGARHDARQNYQDRQLRNDANEFGGYGGYGGGYVAPPEYVLDPPAPLEPTTPAGPVYGK